MKLTEENGEKQILSLNRTKIEVPSFTYILYYI